MVVVVMEGGEEEERRDEITSQRSQALAPPIGLPRPRKASVSAIHSIGRPLHLHPVKSLRKIRAMPPVARALPPQTAAKREFSEIGLRLDVEPLLFRRGYLYVACAV